MFFPFWYNDEIILYKNDKVNYNKLLTNISKKNNGLQTDLNHFEWQSKKGVLKSHIPIKISILTDEITVKIKYHVNLLESNILLLLGIAFATFFFMQNHKNLIIISAIIGVVLWLINTTRLNYFVRKQLKYFYLSENNINQQYLWEKQKEWIKQPNLCPACGEPINPYSINCTKCGLKIKKKKSQTIPSNNNNISQNNTGNILFKINYKK